MPNVLPVPVRDSVSQTPEEIRRILNRAQDGDSTVLPALRKLLEMPGIAKVCGDLAGQLERTLIEKVAGKDLVLKEGLLAKLDSMRAELAGANPTPLERLLVDRIVTCWLHLHDTEIRFVQRKEWTVYQAGCQQRAISACQRRYLAAIKSLALVRKLAKPVLQVNIARKQQVNVVDGSRARST